MIYKLLSPTAAAIPASASEGSQTPWPFLAAFLTGVVAIGVAVWTTYSNARRLKEQLAHETTRLAQQLAAESDRQVQRLTHEAQQKDADRLLTLRKEVYLQLPSTLHDALDSLRNLPLRDSDEGLGSGVSGFTRLASQVGLLSQSDTSDAVMALDEQLQKSWLAYLEVVRPAQVIRRELKLVRGKIQDITESLDRLKPLLERAILSGDRDLQAGVLNSSAALNQALDNAIANARRLEADLHQSILSVSESYAAIELNLHPFNAKVMRMIRRDVGFDVDLDAFERNFHARQLRIADGVHSFASAVRRGKP